MLCGLIVGAAGWKHLVRSADACPRHTTTVDTITGAHLVLQYCRANNSAAVQALALTSITTSHHAAAPHLLYHSLTDYCYCCWHMVLLLATTRAGSNIYGVQFS